MGWSPKAYTTSKDNNQAYIMIEQFRQHINDHLNVLHGKKLLLAVSGGLDSVVMTHLCHQLKLNLALAHCNFNLRPVESDLDEEFVLALAEGLDLDVFIESFDTETYAKEEAISIQMAARELRYNWFFELAAQLDFDYVLTAHHADDNLETFLINLTRGTGLEGLLGIPEVSNQLVRPLLPFSRERLEAYAKKEHLEWREDATNASTKYLRNKLRHDIIPILKEVNPHVLQNFQTTIANLQESQGIIEDAVVKIQKKAVTVEQDQIKLDVLKLKKLSHPKAYLYQLLKEFNFTAWDDIVNLLNAQSGKQVFSSTHRILKDRDFLLLSDRNVRDQTTVISIKEEDKDVVTPMGHLSFKEVDNRSETSKNRIYADADRLQYPLTLRQWQVGDFFYPLGMNGKKKLSKYFKDEKLSLMEKEKVWILCSAEDVVWVVGRRQDDRFKITENTRNIIKIEVH